MHKVFIDGAEGTTGLRIHERLAGRADLELIKLPEAERKSAAARADALNSCDLAILCLPDDAAREAAALTTNPAVRIIDCSTAHRTAPGWTYGFPELSAERREAIKNAKRVANPGCHASGFISLVYPLVAAGILPASALLTCHSVTGYSGGGKKMIAGYEAAERDVLLDAPRQYGLTQTHKHLPEMKAVCGLYNEPVFCPIVSDYYAGMMTTVPVFASQLEPGYGIDDIKAVYAELYRGPVVTFRDGADEEGFLSGGGLSGSDAMEITVRGNADRILLISRFDNLGKGASGSAVQCMNIMLGFGETEGLAV